MSIMTKFCLLVVLPPTLWMPVMIIGLSNGWPEFWAVFPFVALGMIGWTVFFVSYNISEKRNEHKPKFNKENHQLVLTGRNPIVADSIYPEAELNIGMNYNPAEISVTSIGIGNVRTTSVDYYNESTVLSATKTGAYCLVFSDGDIKKEEIYSIRLSADLVKEARENEFISQFLDVDVLVLRDAGRKMTDLEKTAISHHNRECTLKSAAVAVNAMLKSNSKSILSLDDCNKIIKWIRGKNRL